MFDLQQCNLARRALAYTKLRWPACATNANIAHCASTCQKLCTPCAMNRCRHGYVMSEQGAFCNDMRRTANEGDSALCGIPSGCLETERAGAKATTSSRDKGTEISDDKKIFNFYDLTSAVARNMRTRGRVAPAGSHFYGRTLAHAEQQGLARPNNIASSRASSEQLATHR